MGTYDIAFKQTNTQTGDQGQVSLNEAIEALENGDLELAREKFLLAIEAFRLTLSSKKHDRISREGIITAWEHLAHLYEDPSQEIFPEECVESPIKDTKSFTVNSLKTAFIDNILEGDWKKQCNGKYGGMKPSNMTWKQFYFENEKEIDKLSGAREKMIWAVENGHDALLTFLISKEKELNVNEPTKKGSAQTLLEIAVKHGYFEVVKILIDQEAKVTAKGTGKWTPLHWAVYMGHEDIVVSLLENGAKANVKDDKSITPLHIAAFNGFDDIVTLLLEKGARVNVLDKGGKFSPLYLAIYNDHYDIAQDLLENGANIKHVDKHNRSLLHWAASHGKVDIVDLLIKKGANVNAKDDLKRAPIHWAAQCGYHDVIASLIEHKAKINEADKFGNRPMLISAFCNHTKDVSLLFENGAR